MNLTKALSNLPISKEDIIKSLRMLELTHEDIASIGQTENRFVNLLRKYSLYSESIQQQSVGPFEYSGQSDPHLTRLRENFNLDTIAGKGSEIERLCNLMQWAHNLATHTSAAVKPKKMNSLNLIHLIQTEGKLINCGMFAIILNDIYLSLGWKSRVIHLKPYKENFRESHVVNSVYCRQLEKWLFFDPNLNAYFMSETGEILSIVEVRERFINGSELLVNDELTFNSDNLVFAALGQHYGKDFYLLYIAKNIFRYNCSEISNFDEGSGTTRKTLIELLPVGYRSELLSQSSVTKKDYQITYTADLSHFWQ